MEMTERQRQMTECEGKQIGKTEVYIYIYIFWTVRTKPRPPEITTQLLLLHRIAEEANGKDSRVITKQNSRYTPLTLHASPQGGREIVFLFCLK